MLNCVVVTCEANTGIPFKVSFTSTLVNEVPPARPTIATPVSSLAMIIGAVTVIVTIAGSQFNGLSFSQI